MAPTEIGPIWDQETIDDALSRAITEAKTGGARRRAVASVLAQARDAGLKQIAAAFGQTPHSAAPVTAAYSRLTDHIVQTAFAAVATHFHPLPNPTAQERLAVVAVGGYGRGEMALHSDVDLLFVTPYKLTPWAESVVETLLYILWDLKLKLGHATRSIQDCLRLGRQDFTIRTTLVEMRHIAGDEKLISELRDDLSRNLFRSTGPEFVEAKLEERATRHKRHGGQRYLVEPHVKEGKGGLRDLQSLFWMAKYVHDVQTAGELVDLGFLTADEFDSFQSAEEFLWAVRCHLHLIAGRPMDQLTFDLQVEVAQAMGYQSGGGRRAVEHFMQDYFKHATKVGELTRIFLTVLEQQHVKRAPDLAAFFRRRRKLRTGFRMRQNRLDVAQTDLFTRDKLNILRIFEEALRTGYFLHPDAMRLISANLELIDEDLRAAPEAQRIFLDILLKHGNPERGLRRMNELGVLARFIPEFEPIVAMMQFNMYHSYTVDEHTIQCISQFAQIEKLELEEELPICSEILKAGINRKVLFVALLLHDIGKGREEDHSILGARMARKIAPRLGLNKADSETVEWLIRHHLLMSDMAQKRDIADPRTVRDFAKAVGTQKRLDLLTVLTVCDIRGVGPTTWNNWKAVLIRGLYNQTSRALSGGMEELNRQHRGDEAKRKLRAALPDWDAKALRAETGRHYPSYWQGLHVSVHVIFAHLLRDLDAESLGVDLQPDADRDATRACFAMADHPGIFSRMCGALALVGANVVDARSFTSKDGFATAAFWIQDQTGSPFEKSRLKRLETMIRRTLRGEVVARDAMQDKDKINKRERAFRVPTSITFDNEGSEIYTIIEVDTRDRPGLLFDLTRCLAHANINIENAVVATYGEQVVDSFYVKDTFGHKLHAQTKRDQLEQKLKEAISKGAERALS